MYAFVKGHGTENDFVIVPEDVDLTPERARALCDRRAGIGGDGVIRAAHRDGRWFMDYRNSDGSISEMCGNGIRVFARYLVAELGVPAGPLEIDTRDGVKTVHSEAGQFTVDMGTPELLGPTTVEVDGRRYAATRVSMGNPHAVVFVDDLAEAGALLEAPAVDPEAFPDGANVEFVVRRPEGGLAMRVHERGSGETRSCGTGACAAVVASLDGPGASRDIDVPGGRLTVTWTDDDRVLLTGPAVLVAWGTTSL
jgi:diaminopimelate epimerase